MFIWLKTMRLSITNNTAAEDSAAQAVEKPNNMSS